MGNPVVHFAIYADDPLRAMAFYEAVFGWSFEPWGPPEYWKIETGSGLGAPAGALSKRAEAPGEGTPNAYRCTIAVADCDASIAFIEQHGGTRASPTVTIPTVGSVAEFRDPEGNLACVMAYAEGSPFRLSA